MELALALTALSPNRLLDFKGDLPHNHIHYDPLGTSTPEPGPPVLRSVRALAELHKENENAGPLG